MMRISSQPIVRTALTTLHAGHFFHRDSHKTLLIWGLLKIRGNGHRGGNRVRHPGHMAATYSFGCRFQPLSCLRVLLCDGVAIFSTLEAQKKGFRAPVQGPSPPQRAVVHPLYGEMGQYLEKALPK